MARHQRFISFLFAFGMALIINVSAAEPQTPLRLPRLMLRTIMTAVDLTDEQKSTIASIVDHHREALLAARAAQDPMALRMIMRDVVQQIIGVLAPEQREAAKAAFAQAMAGAQTTPK